MKVQAKKITLNKIEIHIDDIEFNENGEWNSLIANLLYSISKSKKALTLFSMRANKESLLYELGNAIENKFDKSKFLTLNKSTITLDECKLIVEDYEFYLGGFYIVFFEPSAISLPNFLNHLFSQEPFYKFTNTEYIFMSHDGEMIKWVNPSDLGNVLIDSNLNISFENV